jgi:hypothetical protein
MRGLLATLTTGLAMLGTASGASGAPPAHGSIAGIVPHAGRPASVQPALTKSIPFSIHTALTFGANYESLINRYFTDVAHDSGGASNVYSVDPQYTDATGAANYDSAFGASYVSHDPLPANGCGDGVDPVCLTDQQLQDEIQHVLRVKGWQGGLNNMFFLMTPDGVGSCVDGVSNQCSTNVFCAYHNYFVDTSSEDVIYANEPFEATLGGCSNPFDQGFPKRSERRHDDQHDQPRTQRGDHGSAHRSLESCVDHRRSSIRDRRPLRIRLRHGARRNAGGRRLQPDHQ